MALLMGALTALGTVRQEADSGSGGNGQGPAGPVCIEKRQTGELPRAEQGGAGPSWVPAKPAVGGSLQLEGGRGTRCI